MLIPIESFFQSNIKQPKTKFEETILNLQKKFQKFSWYENIFLEKEKNHKNVFVIKSKYEIDTDQLPTRYDEYQIKYLWENKKQLSITEALEKFQKKFSKEPWFKSITIEKNQIWVKLNFLKHNLPDFYENYPIRFSL